MSLVRRGEDAFDDTPVEIARYESGGSFSVGVIASNLGAQDLTISAYTRAHQAAEEVLAKAVTISGPTPDDPAVATLELVTAQPVRFVVVLSTSSPATCPWWVMSEGQVATIEDGEVTTEADGTEQTVAESLYPGVFMLLVDVSELDTGDDLELRLKTKRGGTFHTQLHQLLEDVLADKLYEFGPIVVAEAAQATIEQSDGTFRNFPTNLVRLGA